MQFTAKTLRAVLRGRLNNERMVITFVYGRRRYSGSVVNMGSLISARVGETLMEDIHPSTVVHVEIV